MSQTQKAEVLARRIGQLAASLETALADGGEAAIAAVPQLAHEIREATALVFDILRIPNESPTQGERFAALDHGGLMKATADLMRSKRRRYGVAPLGFKFDADGKLVEVPQEQKLLARAQAMLEEGASYRQTAVRLTAEGFRTRRGGRITIGNVQSIWGKRNKATGRGVHAPWGYRRSADGSLVRDENEQRLIRVCVRLRKSGLGYRAIAKELTAQGFVARSGNPLASAQIFKILEQRRTA